VTDSRPVPPVRGFARSSIEGLVAFGPEATTTPAGTHVTRVVVVEHRASNQPRPQTVFFTGHLAEWAASHLKPGATLHASGFGNPADTSGLWATRAQANDLPPVSGEIVVKSPPPDEPALTASLQSSDTAALGIKTAPTYKKALQEPVLRCAISEKVSREGQAALTNPPASLRSLNLRPGFTAWLPSSIADELMVWSAEHKIPIHIARARSFECLMPDHPVGPQLGKAGIRLETANDPCFRNTLRANQWGELFALQKGPQGPCGICAVPLQPTPAARVAAGDVGLWISNPAGRRDDKLVVVNSPIEALAYHQMHASESVRYLATSTASPTADQKRTIRDLVEGMTNHNSGTPPRVIIACGRDADGDRFARAISDACGPTVAPRRDTPQVGRDWAEAVRIQERALVLESGGVVSRPRLSR
jgi:hypothetical protein